MEFGISRNRHMRWLRLLTGFRGYSQPRCTVSTVYSMPFDSNLNPPSLFATTINRVVHRDRVCWVSQLYGMSLRDLLTNDVLYPLPPRHITIIIWQIFRAIKCMSSDVLFRKSIGWLYAQSCMNFAWLTRISSQRTLCLSTIHFWRLETSIRMVYFLTRCLIMILFREYTVNDTQMVLKTPEIRIIDLDDAVVMDRRRRYMIGSNRYRAPEVLIGKLSAQVV